MTWRSYPCRRLVTRQTDDVILKFLLNERDRPIVANPSTVEANIDYKISHVRRLRALQDGGLVEYYDQD